MRALDAATVLALVLTAFVFLFGGFIIHVWLTPVRVHSSERLLFIGVGLLVSGQRRVLLDLFDKLSPAEYAAFHSDPVVEATPIPRAALEVVA